MTDRLRFHRYLARETESVERDRDEPPVIELRGPRTWYVHFAKSNHELLQAPRLLRRPLRHLFAVWSHTSRYESNVDRLAADLDPFTLSEREVILRVEHGPYGVREYARRVCSGGPQNISKTETTDLILKPLRRRGYIRRTANIYGEEAYHLTGW